MLLCDLFWYSTWLKLTWQPSLFSATKAGNVNDILINAAKRKATTERPQKDSSQLEMGEAETSKKVRCFNRKWSEEFGWLRYDDNKKNMFCQTCREAFQTATTNQLPCCMASWAILLPRTFPLAKQSVIYCLSHYCSTLTLNLNIASQTQLGKMKF